VTNTLIAAAAACAASTANAQPAHGPVVCVDAGRLQGAGVDDMAVFKGVPFAKPPVGVWRWRPPQRPDPWSGVRPAVRYGAPCMQKMIEDNGVGPGPPSEDCLTLNVFAPMNALHASGGARLPVMVWIHGGGFVNGSGTANLYDGSSLARQGVVVVSLNYRLGPFGMFAHPALTAETPKTFLANYGLMDQIAALQWVRRNIDVFGGDPANVTLFGESAGGMSVNRLMTIRTVRGLFHKAIAQSGLGREHCRSLSEAEAQGEAFAAALGAPQADALALRALPADVVQAAAEKIPQDQWRPVIDGRLLTEGPEAAFAAGREAKVPYLVGSNSLEFPPAWTPSDVKAQAQVPIEARERVRAAYGSHALYEERIVTDVLFTEPARSLARDHAISGGKTYLYRFAVLSTHAPKGLTGAPHASDRQYVFQTLNASPWPTDAVDAARAAEISAYWTSFAKSGDPNGAGRPTWPAYGSRDELMEFANAGAAAKPTPDAPVLDAIAESYGAKAEPR